MSTVKLLTTEIESSKGVRYSAMAASISHEDGTAEGVKSEMVIWYVGAYLSDLVIRLASLTASSGFKDLVGRDLMSLDVEDADWDP